MQPDNNQSPSDQQQRMALLQQALAQNQQQNQSVWPQGLPPVVPASQAAPQPAAFTSEQMLQLLLQSLHNQQAQQVQPAPPPQPVPELPVAPQVSQPPPIDTNHALLQLFGGNRDGIASQLQLLLQPQNREPGLPLASPQQAPSLPLPSSSRQVDLSGSVAALHLGVSPSGSARPGDVAGPSRGGGREDALGPQGGVTKPATGDSKQKNREAQRRFRERQKSQIQDLKERAQRAEEQAAILANQMEQLKRENDLLLAQLQSQHPSAAPPPPSPPTAG